MKLLNKWSTISNRIKASIIFLFANLFQKGMAFICSPIYTRVLSPNEFGEVSVFLSWFSLIGIIAMFCLSFGVFNNGMLDYEDDRNIFTFSMLILSNMITIIVAILILGSYEMIYSYINMDINLIIFMFILFLTQPALDFWTARQRYEYRYKLSSTLTIVTSILSPLIAIVCIFVFKNNPVYARIYGAYIPLIFIYLGIYIYIGKKANFKVKLAYWKYAIVFNLPLIPHYLSMYVLNNADRLMIASFIGDSEAAFYSVAYNMASVVTIVWTAINSSLIPYTYEKCKEKDFKSISRITIPLLLIYGLACVSIVMLAPELMKIMATSEYKSAIYVIPPIVGGVFFTALYSVFGNIVYYYKKPKYVMMASVISSALNIFLNNIYIPKYGFVAAGYTTLICFIIQALIDYIAMKKVVNKDIYDMKSILVLSFIILLVAILGRYYKTY